MELWTLGPLKDLRPVGLRELPKWRMPFRHEILTTQLECCTSAGGTIKLKFLANGVRRDVFVDEAKRYVFKFEFMGSRTKPRIKFSTDWRRRLRTTPRCRLSCFPSFINSRSKYVVCTFT